MDCFNCEEVTAQEFPRSAMILQVTIVRIVNVERHAQNRSEWGKGRKG